MDADVEAEMKSYTLFPSWAGVAWSEDSCSRIDPLVSSGGDVWAPQMDVCVCSSLEAVQQEERSTSCLCESLLQSFSVTYFAHTCKIQ